MKENLAIFENFRIRRVYDEKAETWYFSVVDVVAALTDSENPRDYWFKMKIRVKGEDGLELSTIEASSARWQDAKHRHDKCRGAPSNNSINSLKAEPFKQWLAKVGYERMQEMADPEKSLNRARENWQKHGRSEKWIQQQMTGQETRNKLTDYWKGHEIKDGEEFAILTNIIHQEWADVTVKEHKALKGLKSQNLRDHMSEAELIFTVLAELSTRQIAESVNATGMDENKAASKKGGGIARKTRRELESTTGKSVISGQNYLPPKKVKKK